MSIMQRIGNMDANKVMKWVGIIMFLAMECVLWTTFKFWGAIFVTAYILVMVWAGLNLSKTSAFVYAGLDKIMAKAKAAKSDVELLIVHKELEEFHKNYCVIKHYGNRAREVSAYIHGRLNKP